jgi:hypothetical protein
MASRMKPMRVNPTNPTHAFLPAGSDKNPKRYVGGGWVPSKKQPGMAVPNRRDIWAAGTYAPGMGEVGQAARPGSEDFLAVKSRGNLT